MFKWVEWWRERKRNQKKQYTLSFRKTNKSLKLDECKEICDWKIIDVIENLSNQYDVQIVQLNIRDCFTKSYIRFACTEDVKHKVIHEFTKSLGAWISDVNI